MASILNIINTLRNKIIYLRTIDHIWIDAETIKAGNNAVTARCRIMGREGDWLIKCYYRPKQNLKSLYGDNIYEKELGVYSIDGKMEYIDILLMPWVDGEPLESLIRNEKSNYRELSKAFDRFALELLEAEYAHGDIKPDNIIVSSDLQMRAIDLDAMWRPDLNNYPLEIGTQAYRHPRRTHNYFKKAIDDYPLALISTTLAALALDRDIEKMLNSDKTLFTPEECVYDDSASLTNIIALFRKHKDLAHENIAQGLRSSSPMIYGLHKMFYVAIHGNDKGYKRPKHEEHKIVISPEQLTKARTHAAHKPHRDSSKNNSRIWTPNDDLKLATLLFDGNKISSIARHMNRSERAIRTRAKKLKLPISELNLRKTQK